MIGSFEECPGLDVLGDLLTVVARLLRFPAALVRPGDFRTLLALGALSFVERERPAAS
jgi:hypothetical protein